MFKIIDTTKVETVATTDSIIHFQNKPIIAYPELNTNNTSIINENKIIIINNKTAKLWDTPEQNSFSKTYIFEPWQELISVNNKICKTYIIHKPVFKTNKIDTSNTKVLSNINYSQLHLNQYGTFTNNITLFLLLFSFALLSLTKVSFGKFLNQFLRSTINYSEASKLYQDHNIIINRLYFVLNIIFVISGGLYIYYLIKQFQPSLIKINSAILLLGCFGIILILYFIKFLITKTLGFILFQIQAFNEYLYNTYLYFKIIGLFLLPLVSIKYILIENYKINLLIFGILIIIIVYISSIFRATRIILQKGILLFHWILYICILELLPILLLYKYLSSFL